ncbi:hypothetical protein [Nocardioides sp. SYSU DS0663]|uniref:hypothetical protein n=1 Tax=Nocardioides sp. SYSU DS0663 TaxID=3416445 RepID=UPI003F4C158E
MTHAVTHAVLDLDALARLGRDLQDGQYAVVFARRYQSMLPARVERIVAALVAGDLVAAMDAVLSLKVSSITVGTTELAAAALEVEQAVRRRDVASARRRADGLAGAANRADWALAGYLADHAGR